MSYPEDVMKTAREIVAATYDNGGYAAAGEMVRAGRSDGILSVQIAARAILQERERATLAERERWLASDEAARENGLMLSPFDLAEAVMAERERCAQIAETPRCNTCGTAREPNSDDCCLWPDLECANRHDIAVAIRSAKP